MIFSTKPKWFKSLQKTIFNVSVIEEWLLPNLEHYRKKKQLPDEIFFDLILQTPTFLWLWIYTMSTLVQMKGGMTTKLNENKIIDQIWKTLYDRFKKTGKEDLIGYLESHIETFPEFFKFLWKKQKKAAFNWYIESDIERFPQDSGTVKIIIEIDSMIQKELRSVLYYPKNQAWIHPPL